ncbi:MAG: hypothetical protein L3K26_20140 [Candidatus Hydrogenedentes bacterium]|nr:hypothetical protein [Candidatus Hydrogenedentota bacterium]
MPELSTPAQNTSLLIALLIAVLPFALMQPSAGAEVAKAQPKKGKTFAPTLSTSIPEEITALPSFGTITWKTTQLPWVGEGPYEGISGAGMVKIDGKIYVVGGFIPGSDGTDDATSNRTSRWTWRYDPETQQWSQMTDAPIRREYTRAVAADGKLYLTGGGCQYKGQEPTYRVHGECAVFDPLAGPKGTWTRIDSLNVPRTHMSVGYAGGKLVIAGGNEYDAAEKGYSHATIRGTTEVYDPANPAHGWQVKSPISGAPRGWCASMVAQGQLYLFGGITWRADNAIAPTPETLRYDPNTDTWTPLASLPVPISGWEGALYANRYAINVAGAVRPEPGSGEGLVWSDLVLAYDTERDRWMKVGGALPPGAVFNDPGVVVIGDTIYVLGAEGPHGTHYNYFLVGRIVAETQ